jgi:hypothetical protein
MAELTKTISQAKSVLKSLTEIYRRKNNSQIAARS